MVWGSVNNKPAGVQAIPTGKDAACGARLRYNWRMPQTRIATAPSRPARRLRGLWGLAIALSLAGCGGNGPDAAFAEYLARLGRTLSVDAPAVAPPALPERPRPGLLQVDIPPAKIDTLDFLALSGCKLQVTIGKRNSSLGRLARPSQRLLLELEYLRLAPECIEYQRGQGRAALADTLQQAWDDKRRLLAVFIFNATLASSEYLAFWQPRAAPGDYPAGIGSTALDALRGINAMARRWLAGEFSADNLEFEILLGEVGAGDGGALLQALAVQDAWLAAADRMVDARLARGPLCAPGFRLPAADILPNVVRRFFVEGIQPRSAQLGARYHALLPPVSELEELLASALPPAYRDWQARRDAALATTTAAPRRHVGRLQALLEPCNQGQVPP